MRLQFFADRTVPFRVSAVARRTTGLILDFTHVVILSRGARNKTDDRTGNHQPLHQGGLRKAIELHLCRSKYRQTLQKHLEWPAL